MELTELRDRIRQVEGTIDYIEFQDSMSQSDFNLVDKLNKELKALHEELRHKEYYQVVFPNSTYEYLHKNNMVGSSPYPFISEEEAKQALKEYEEECPNTVGVIVRHSEEA